MVRPRRLHTLSSHPPPGVRGQGRYPPCSHLFLQPDILLSCPVGLIHVPHLSGDDAIAATSRPLSPTSAKYSSGQRRTSHYQYLQLSRATKVSISEQPIKQYSVKKPVPFNKVPTYLGVRCHNFCHYLQTVQQNTLHGNVARCEQ